MPKISFFLVLFSYATWASKFEIAEEAFINNPDVTSAIRAAQSRNMHVEPQPAALYLSGSCGFVGCYDDYLVSVGTHERTSVNPQSSSVLAKVTLLNSKPYSVTLIDSSEIK